jgi:uncharacterized protein YtpQ (UPF0354 family)
MRWHVPRAPLVALALCGTLAGCEQRAPTAPPGEPVNLAERLRDELGKLMPDIQIQVKDEGSLVVKGANDVELTISLDNLRLKCQSTPEACQAAVVGFAASVHENLQALAADTRPERSMIRAVLKHADYMQKVREMLAAAPRDKAEDNAVLHRKFMGDLWITYVLDRPNSTSLLTRSDLKKLALPEAEVHELALENLRQACPDVPAKPVESMPGLWAVEVGDSYEAARLLLPDLWAPYKEKVQGELIAVAPVRDAVMFTGSQNRPALQAMQLLAEQLVANEAYSLSRQFLRWTPAGWVEYTPRPEP